VWYAIYNLLWYAALPFALSASGGRDIAVKVQRQGRMAVNAVGAPRVWIHAASVGEVEGVRAIAAGILHAYEHAAIIVTTMTAAGRDAAIARIPGAAAVMFAPLDFAPAVRSFLESAKPHLVLIAENELWPNYMIRARRTGARVVIVNGRMSERSASRYRLMRSLFGRALRSAELIMAQTEADANRYASLGVERDRIVVGGNTKLESAHSARAVQIRPALERFAAGCRIFIAASTAAGEEDEAIRAYVAMRRNCPDLAMILAPRHLEHCPLVAAALAAAGLRFDHASSLNSDDAASSRVLLLDTMGELRSLFPRAAFAFVGGSLVPGRGGQSPAEAAAAGVPVIVGPHHEKQADLVELLAQVDGLKIARDAEGIAAIGSRWLANEADRARAGKSARDAILAASGAVERALAKILPMLSTAV
jgi:3-deoxy-D-manno-octulosonic-acid transferase